MTVFKGFASPNRGNTQVLYDVEIVKRDLINHFNTRKGEKPMNQEYGFIGWDLLFELDTIGTKGLLESDARRIIQTDPRVEERRITVQQIENGYNILIELHFVVLDTVDQLYMQFIQDAADTQL